jgi:hypothetical protein
MSALSAGWRAITVLHRERVDRQGHASGTGQIEPGFGPFPPVERVHAGAGHDAELVRLAGQHRQ